MKAQNQNEEKAENNVQSAYQKMDVATLIKKAKWGLLSRVDAEAQFELAMRFRLVYAKFCILGLTRLKDMENFEEFSTNSSHPNYPGNLNSINPM
jgi:hypothetical protein